MATVATRDTRRIAAVLAVALAFTGGGVVAQEGGLFRPPDPEVADSTDGQGAQEPRLATSIPTRGGETVRHREARLDFTRLAAVKQDVESGRTAALNINLFEDVSFKAVDLRIARTSSGGYSLSGRLEGVLFGSAVLVVNGEVVVGSIRAATGTYTIDAKGEVCHIRKVDSSTLPPLAEPLRAPPSLLGPKNGSASRWNPASGTKAGNDDHSVIDVLVVYTPAVKEALGGEVAAVGGGGTVRGRDQPGIRGQRRRPGGIPHPGRGGGLCGGGQLLLGPLPSRRDGRRTHGHRPRTAREHRVGSGASHRAIERRVRHRVPAGASESPIRVIGVRAYRSRLRGRDVRARTRPQHGLAPRPLRGLGRHAVSLCSRLCQPGGLRRGRGDVVTLADGHVLSQRMPGRRLRLQRTVAFLECGARVRRRPVGHRRGRGGR